MLYYVEYFLHFHFIISIHGGELSMHRSNSHSSPDTIDKNKLTTQQESSTINTVLQYASTGFTLFNSIIAPLYDQTIGKLPYNACLWGYPFLGKFTQLFQPDGRGLDRLITNTAKLATENNGIAWFRLGPSKNVVLVTEPDDIKTIMKDQITNLSITDNTGSFRLFFGPDSIFAQTPFSEKWKELRRKFKHSLFTEDTLAYDVQPMQSIIDELIFNIETANANIVNDLEQFCNSITIEMICLKLALKISEKDKENISRLIHNVILEIANPWNQFIAPYHPLYNFKQTKLSVLLESAWELLKKIITENEKAIRTSKNWLNPRADVNIDLSLESLEKIKYDVAQFLVAGHETTAKLLLFSLILLTDKKHEKILDEFRREISEKSQQLPVEKWTRETLKNLPYLDAVINEVLRLYPPIPDMIIKVSNPFSFKNDTCHLNSGDIIIISQRITGCLKKIWGDNALEFSPERFMKKNSPTSYEYFPFGFMPRQCIGQHFAKQEVKLILVRMMSKFNLRLSLTNGDPLLHPIPTNHIFTLQIGLKNIRFEFTPRSQEQEFSYNNNVCRL